MSKKEVNSEIERLNQQRATLTQAAAGGLSRLAFGSIADAVRLMRRWEELSDEEIETLDLFCVSELKQSKGGGLEMKFHRSDGGTPRTARAIGKAGDGRSFCILPGLRAGGRGAAGVEWSGMTPNHQRLLEYRKSFDRKGGRCGLKFVPFSKKQMGALTWWCPGSPYRGRDAVICDGAIRSGKTLCLSLSFVGWAFAAFRQGSFAVCGKTLSSLQRNLVRPLMESAGTPGIPLRDAAGPGMSSRSNTVGRSCFFTCLGGRDESSAALIQGTTLSGVLFDEVALMPRSFVEQALARCSVEGSKFWFNCNPEHPHHWFYTEWILKKEQRTRCTFILP